MRPTEIEERHTAPGRDAFRHRSHRSGVSAIRHRGTERCLSATLEWCDESSATPWSSRSWRVSRRRAIHSALLRRRAAVAPRLAVSPSGSDANDCTTARPCKTLARAFGVARAGDVVAIAGGEYPGERITGSRGGTVTFEAAPKAKVLLTGRLELASVSDVVVRGLEVSHAVLQAGVVVGPAAAT